MTTVERVAARIIARTDAAHPADAVLRAELREARLSRDDSRMVAEAVFSHFRWRGWLDAEEGITRRIAHARELDMRFATEPNGFTTAELQRAIPEWINSEVDVTRAWLVSLQTWPSLWLRAKRGTGGPVGTLVGDCERAAGNGELLADALEYHGEEDLFRTPEFQSGKFEVQDIASQMVGLTCDPQPGETWWDACAGEGGKLLHLSDLMQNKGLIWASDRSVRRLAKLKQRTARAKAFNYRAVPWEGGPKLPTKTKFDGVLIDAPCSGVGTWQRNPHARWTTTLQDVQELAAIQRQLVVNAAAAVKPGGRIIYAVCTLTRSETDGVADLCSPALPGFAPTPLRAWPNEPPAASDRRWIWPQTCRGNGMYLKAWKRVG